MEGKGTGEKQKVPSAEERRGGCVKAVVVGMGKTRGLTCLSIH